MKADLEKAFDFWLTVGKIFEELKKEQQCVQPALAEVFPNADMMFRIKLHLVIDLGDNRIESCPDDEEESS